MAESKHGDDVTGVLSEDHELESRLSKSVLKLEEIDNNIYR